MRISAGFLLFLAGMLLLAPLEWIIAFAVAAGFHELCHLAAIRVLTGNSAKVRLYANGAQMPIPQMSAGREAVCAISGPLGGLMLLPLVGILPRIAICSAIQSVYNLLPIYPFDGGRALRCATAMLFPPNIARAVCRWMEVVFVILLIVVSIYASFWLKLGLFPLLLSLLLLIRIK